MTDKAIRIVLDSKGAKSNADALNNSVKGIGTSANATTFAVSKLSAAIGAVIASASLGGIAKMVQDFNAMSERVRMATGSVEEFNMVQARLNETANGTYRSLAEAQEIYIQTEASLKGLGYTTSQTLDIVDSMSYAFVRNAASVDRANGAISAFNSATAKGKVEADGWATIVKAIPSIVDDIATATGKSANEIRTLGATGKLALTDLTEGFRMAREQNKELADGMQVTLVDAGVRARNAMTNLFVAIENKYGTIQTITKEIIEFSDYAGSPEFAAGIIEAFEIISLTARSVKTDIVDLKNEFQLLADIGSGSVSFLGNAFKNLLPNVKSLTQVLTVELAVGIDKVRTGATALFEVLSNPFDTEKIRAAMDAYTKEMERINQVRQESIQYIFDEREAILSTAKANAQAASAVSGVSSSGRTDEPVNIRRSVGGDDAKAANELKKIEENSARTVASAQSVTRQLEAELALRRQVADIYRSEELSADASMYSQQMAMIAIREKEQSAIAQARATEEAAQRQERLAALLESDRLTEEARVALRAEFDEQEKIAAAIHQEEMTAIEEEGKNARERLREQERQNAISVAFGLGNQLLGVIQGQSKKGFEIAKKASLASAAVDGVRSALSAWRSGMETPGPWAPAVAAAYTASSLLKTTALINQIKSVNYSSGGGAVGGGGAIGGASMGSGAGGGSSIPSTASTTAVPQKTVIELRGAAKNDTLTIEQVSDLLEKTGAVTVITDAISDAQRRNVPGVTAR